jgi:hypothetical protein
MMLVESPFIVTTFYQKVRREMLRSFKEIGQLEFEDVDCYMEKGNHTIIIPDCRHNL